MKLQLLLIFSLMQIFMVTSYTINNLQRLNWPNLQAEIDNELISKILDNEQTLSDLNPILATSADQFDERGKSLQKRGRQCLWKVCSWALDKRSIRSSTNDADDLLNRFLF